MHFNRLKICSPGTCFFDAELVTTEMDDQPEQSGGEQDCFGQDNPHRPHPQLSHHLHLFNPVTLAVFAYVQIAFGMNPQNV